MGLADGECVDIEPINGTLVIKRTLTLKSQSAAEAAAAMIKDRRTYPLEDIKLRDVVAEGRRG